MALPTGPAVTFLFTDIEGSTRSERAAGSAAWAGIVARHDALLRAAIERAGGAVVKTEGDAFFAAFADPGGAARAAVDAQRAVAAEPWPSEVAPLRVRMGMHLGEGRLRHGLAPSDPEDYVGIDVNYAARIAAAGNGGQIVVSEALAGAIADAVDADARMTDEGLRAVKDFEEPQRLHRLVVPGAADDDRPLRTLDPPTNLPGEVTALVGRADEIGRLRDLLAQTRILTLTGPGGSGKTRLALGVAQSVRDRFPHGTWFVDLASVRDPGLVEPSMATTLGLRDSGERSMAEALRAHLHDRTMLLVLDNLEQLLPDAATTVATLVRAAPDTRLLITSRELLRIAGEQGHTVPPLDIQAGVELFEARATALRPDLALTDATRATIRAICERLNGLPLAIELAAARVRMLSPQLILERLSSSLDLSSGSRDLPERQRTLRGAIDWSHELLDEPERRLFRRLSVFAGGWTAELAFAVADPSGDLGVDVLVGLESLADKSLVRIEAAGSGEDGSGDEPRFSMHPLLREYAAERLDAAGERGGAEARHAAAVAELVGLVGGQLFGPGGAASIRRIDLEQHNVRAVIDRALASGDVELGIRSMAPIWRWFQQRGRLREGRAVLEQLLAVPGTEPHLRIAALEAEGGLAYWSDDFAAAGDAYAERLALAESLADAGLIADAHYDLGFMSMVAGDASGLREHEQQALELYTSLGDERNLQRTRQALALAMFQMGDVEKALEIEDVNLAAFRAAGSDYLVADSMTFHAGAFYRLGDPVRAWEYVLDGIAWFAEHDNASGVARAIGMAAIVLLDYGDVEAGARVTGATMELVREKGVMLAPVKVLHLPDPTETAIRKLGEARARELFAEGAATPIPVIVEQLAALPAPGGASGG